MKRLLILVLVAQPLTVRAQTCQPPSPCQPDDEVKVNSPSLDKTKATILTKVTLVPATATSANVETTLKSDVTEPTELRFVVPKETANGTYQIQIKQAPKPTDHEQPAAKAIDDLSPNQIVVLRPAITAVSRAAAFADDRGVNNLNILGTGFRKDASISFHFTKRATPPNCADATPIKQKCYDLIVNDETQITLSFHALDPSEAYFDGPQEFAIKVNGLDTNTANLALVNVTQTLPIKAALIGLGLIVVMTYLLIQSGKETIKQTFMKNGKTEGTSYILTAMFLDVQTYSYSLSKCQFYAWTAAAVLGYLFLTVSKSFVQGSAIFPDVPSGLPGILLASAGTAVLSSGIATTKGDKGAGRPEPNLSDFITTGGVVAVDRLQFAVWTVIGIGTFLAIVFKSDPRNITELQSIPSGFLELMGISASAYLGGKLARKPGPTLNAIAISGKTPEKQLNFQLTGMGLSQSAIFSIDDAPIFPDTIRREEGSNEELPKVTQQDPTIGDPSFARMLEFVCNQPKTEWLGERHSFTITNPDAQKAVRPFKIFKVDKDKIEIAAPEPDGKAKLTITGKLLDPDFVKVECKNKSGSAVDLSDMKFSPDQTTFTAKAGEVNAGEPMTVTVRDTAGVEVEKDITVKQPTAHTGASGGSSGTGGTASAANLPPKKNGP